MPTLTNKDLKAIAPNANTAFSAELVENINKYAGQYGIDTNNRLAAFMAQAAHETDGFRTLEEYASGAKYEGRTDLGNTQKGDGVKFKGRGIFQITGRANYARISQKMFGDDRLLRNPELLEKPEYAAQSAMIYWNEKNLNKLADKGTVTSFNAITKAINGGYNGLEDRKAYYERAKTVFPVTQQKAQGVKM
jgi:putative chitinase